MYERAAAKVCVDGRRVQVEELVHGVDCGLRHFAVNRWDHGFSKLLTSSSTEVAAMMGGEEPNNNLQS